MEFQVGDSVQAIDELGRWEAAKVLEVREGGYQIHFTNWVKIYDCFVKLENVRKPVCQFHHAVDVASRSRRRGKRARLSQLCEGDVVLTSVDGVQMEARVIVFDRFKQEVLVCCGGNMHTVAVSDVSIKDAESVMEQEPKQTSKQRLKGRRRVVAPSLMVEENTETPDNPGTAHKYYTVMNKFGVDVACGECYRIEPGGIHVAIDRIKKSKGEFVADCTFITSGTLDRDVAISVPVDRLVKEAVPLNRADKSSANKVKKAAFWGSVQASKDDGQVRSDQRTQQLALLIRKEVKLALASKTRCRTFSLGVCDLPNDLELFKLDPFVQSRESFSYLNGNLSHLDRILGHRWDVLERGQNVSFVTRVVVALTKGIVSMRVFTSLCNLLVPNDDTYRTILAENISQSAPIDDNVEDLQSQSAPIDHGVVDFEDGQ